MKDINLKKWVAGLVVALIAIGGIGYWGHAQFTKLQRTEVALSNQYNRAFFNTLDRVQGLEILLSKSLIASGREMNDELLNRIWQQSRVGMDSITQLPVRDVTITRTAKFFNQMGDFCRQLAENTDDGGKMTEEQREKLKQLYRQAGELNSELQEVESDVTEGNISFVEMARKTKGALDREGKKVAGANFQNIDEIMSEYPTLIYDGPFSDHMTNREPQALKGEEEIDESRAKSVAEKFVDDREDINYIAQVTGDVMGKIPSYRVELTPRKNGDVVGNPVVMDVSKKGGEPVWSFNNRNIENEEISVDRARQEAQEYLKERGFDNMKSTYHQGNGFNGVTFNFIPVEEDVKIYPDMIKTTAAMDNGEIIGMDARGYLMHHKNRNLSEPKLSEQEAREKLGNNVEVEGKGQLAVIPTDTNEEKLTWEFKGKMGDNDFLIYINAKNGEGEQILQLIDTGRGTLTM